MVVGDQDVEKYVCAFGKLVSHTTYRQNAMVENCKGWVAIVFCVAHTHTNKEILQNWKKTRTAIFTFCVITFEPIKF